MHILLRIMKVRLEKIKYELDQCMIHTSSVSAVAVRAFPMPLVPQSAYTAGVLFRIRRSRSDDGDFAAEEGMDLLVAALNEHIGDLRKERDRLISDLDRARTEADRLRTEVEALRGGWFMRGTKGPRVRSR